MEHQSPRIRDSSTSMRKKPPKIQISHRVVMRAQSSTRSSKPTCRSHQSSSRTAPSVQQIPSYLPKHSKKESLKPMKSKSLLDNPELVSLRESLEKGGNIHSIETSQLHLLIGHLREYCQFCGLQRQYFEAKEVNQLIEKVNSELTDRSKVPHNYEDAMNSFECQKDEEIDRLSQEIIDFDEETELKRNQLKRKQEKEYENFELIWKIEMPRRYRKLSPQLLNLMTSEKKCARCGDFDKAEEIKKEVDAKMKIELDQAQKNLNSDFREAKEKLIDSQAKEMAIFEDNREHSRILMIARHHEELKPIANRKTIIEIKKAKQPKIDVNISHNITAGNVSKVINDIGLDYEALLPPLLDPTDARFNVQDKTRMNVKPKGKNKNNVTNTILSDFFSESSKRNRREIVTTSGTVFQTQDTIKGFLEYPTASTNENLDNFNDSTTLNPIIKRYDDSPSQEVPESREDLLRAKAIALINEVDKKTGKNTNLKRQSVMNSDNAE